MERSQELAFDCADDHFRSVVESHCMCVDVDKEIFSLNHVDPYGRLEVDKALEYFNLRGSRLPYHVDIRCSLYEPFKPNSHSDKNGTISFLEKGVKNKIYYITPTKQGSGIFKRNKIIPINELRKLGVPDNIIAIIAEMQDVWPKSYCQAVKLGVEIRDMLNDLKIPNVFFVATYDHLTI